MRLKHSRQETGWSRSISVNVSGRDSSLGSAAEIEVWTSDVDARYQKANPDKDEVKDHDEKDDAND